MPPGRDRPAFQDCDARHFMALAALLAPRVRRASSGDSTGVLPRHFLLGTVRRGLLLAPAPLPAFAANVPGSSPSGGTSARTRFEAVCNPAHSRQSDRRGISAQCPNHGPPVGCPPRVSPFLSRPPTEVAFHCSIASSVLPPHPPPQRRRSRACPSGAALALEVIGFRSVTVMPTRPQLTGWMAR
jgi:hypothetical protein